ncbi:conserved hypothetical protein [Ricinus communis]|uniref:Uncharacterized protein n=1 Tax=Ricinus communis TaxID=3988 RepID=B9SS90_RICCO|nr:conserved hypothetical protein [Ricinus communis]
MADPFTLTAVTATLAAATITGRIQVADLGYQMWKDFVYNDTKLQKLIALATDMNQTLVAGKAD